MILGGCRFFHLAKEIKINVDCFVCLKTNKQTKQPHKTKQKTPGILGLGGKNSLPEVVNLRLCYKPSGKTEQSER